MVKTPAPRRTVLEAVEEKLKKRECLVCAARATRRGLCTKHYYQYRWELMQIPSAKRHAFEAELIREGKLALDRQGQRVRKANPFREYAKGY